MKTILSTTLKAFASLVFIVGVLAFFMQVQTSMDKARDLRIKIAINQGYADASVGVPILANPHLVVTTNHALWRHGWIKRKHEEMREQRNENQTLKD